MRGFCKSRAVHEDQERATARRCTIYLGILYSEAVWRKVACTVVTLRFL